MNLIPKPNHIGSQKNGHYTLPDAEISFHLGKFGKHCTQVFSERTGLQAVYQSEGKTDITVCAADDFAPEEYKLSVQEDGIQITSSAENGVINALTSLYQLMENGKVPCCEIHDAPLYAHRGLSFDCARHFFGVGEVKRIIEQMAKVKMNVLHWHLTDDQGWRIESKRFPKLHEQHGNEYYTQADIKDVVEYARIRGIEVEPEIDMPGHVSALLAQYPQYSCSKEPVALAAGGGIFPVILCGGAEATYELIDSLLKEICPLFPNAKFHIGGDEAPKREWEKCPVCQQKIKEESLLDETQLQGYFNNRVMKILAGYGKTAVCWNESIEADNFDKNAYIQYWIPSATDKPVRFIEQGGKFIYSDMFTYYLDYPHSMTSLKRLYEGSLDIGENDYEEHTNLLGLEVCIWGEQLKNDEHLEKKLFPRLYAAAERMWSRKREYADFEQRLKAFLKTNHPSDMFITAESGWNPQGQERLDETFAHLAAFQEAMSAETAAETMENAGMNDIFKQKFATCFFEPSDLPMLAKMMPGF